MKTLLVAMSICLVLVVGCGKKDEGKGKEISGPQNDELIQEVNKVNADLEKIRARDINTNDPEGLKKISAALRESRDKIREIEVRINIARQGAMAEGKSGHMPRLTGERVIPSERSSERMSQELFKKKLEGFAKGLESANSQEQFAAAKSVRELQATYPDRDYSMVIIPLMRIVKTEDANTSLRIVAARALHATDSERGDYAIKGVANGSGDKSVRRVCALLSAERERQDELLEKELDREEALNKR